MRTLCKLAVCLLCFYPDMALSQWSDDFSSEDISEDIWSGDIEKFTIDEGWLRLNDHAAGISYLSAQSDIISDASWEFVFKLDFNPSSSNHARVYLVSDRENLTEPLNGYYLQLGSSDDDICLFRQNGNTVEKIISGRTKTLDASFNQVRVWVTRSLRGEWTLMTDLSGNRDYTLEGGVLDNMITTASYFGIVCTYTSTRSSGFYFDEFHIEGHPYVDMEKPVVISASAGNEQIQILFSEAIASVPAPYENYFDLSGYGAPDYIFQEESPPSVTLHYAEERKPPCGIRHKLTIKNIRDLQDNIMNDTVITVSFPCRAGPYDIVINEIMANPTPTVRLPEYEYIELYNRSDKNIELEDWTFTYGNNTRVFPAYLFPSGGYLLLCHAGAVPDLSGYGATLPLLGSITSITNAGQYLQLKDHEGAIISWIDFTTDWYSDPLKDGGGWALEQIDPEQNCVQMSNWTASTGRNGGTPGTQNSVFRSNPDYETPEIHRIGIRDEHTLLLYVSKPIGNLPSITGITIDPGLMVMDIQVSGKHYNHIMLSLKEPLREDIWYDLSVNEPAYDCSGYEVISPSFHFSLPREIDSLDVIINEILFQPSTDGSTFIEVYNRSAKAILINDLFLSLRDANGKLSTPVPFSEDPFLLLPGHYLVVSRNIASVIEQFRVTDRAPFLSLPDMPSLGRTSGRVVLLNRSLRVIDEVHYNSELHSEFLQLSAGVSLERLHPDLNSLDAGNWHTAAQTAGFGTPGEKNSQFLSPGTTKNEVKLFPEVFSPDNDGFDDVLTIGYSFDTPSLMADVTIFDSSGRLIRQLLQQQLIASEGNIIWDGTDKNRRKAPTGIYIVYFSVYNRDGFNKNFKLPCVVAGRKGK